ncbi:MAG: STAS domain-containing protein [Acidobacteria bacterium]|nr:STAS domain-containing protein [Acidobacteriota bacterium]MBI1982997.1 STAS domain-containing protein [Acidobacteriota bacterium]
MPFYILEKLIDGVIVLDLRGRLTLGDGTEALRVRIRQLIQSGYTQIILNFEGVSYIDSVGLSTLVSTYTTTRREGGDMKLLHLTKRVHDLLQITRLSTVFEIYNSLEDAQRSFNPP